MPFGKIETKIWDSLSIRDVDSKHRDSFKLAFIYLLANKHSNPLGYYVLPLPYMADDLEWSTEKAKRVIKMLEQRGLVAYDDTTRIMWVINYLHYHVIKKDQTEISALTVLENLPASKLRKGLYAEVKKEYPTMKFCAYLELLVLDPSLLGDETVTKQTRDGVTSISISKSNSNSQSKSNTNESNQVIDYLNEKANGRFQHSLSSQKHIRARLQAGATVEDCCLIIDHKIKWLHDEEMAEYLRPETLFCPSHFEGYLAAAIRWDQNGRQRTKKEKLARNKAIAKAGSALYDEEALGDGDGNS